VFVMDLMGFTDCHEIRGINISQPFESSVDVDVVNKEVCKTICSYSISYPNGDVVIAHHSQHDTKPGRDGID